MPVTFNKLEAVNRALVAAGKPALSIVVVKGERAAAENQPRVTTDLLAKAAYIFVVPEMLDDVVSPGENGKALRSFVAHNKIGLAVLDEADLILDWQFDFRPCLRCVFSLIVRRSFLALLTSATLSTHAIACLDSLLAFRDDNCARFLDSAYRADIKLQLRRLEDEIESFASVRRVIMADR